MITPCFAPLTRSIRIMWLLEEMELDYRLETRPFRADGERGFAQATPSGKFPVIEDNGIIVAESGAVVQYLVESYDDGRLAPATGSPLRGRYLQWFHFAEATAAAPIDSYVWLAVYRHDAAENAAIIERFRAAALHHFDLARTSAYLGRLLARPGFVKALAESRRLARS